MTNELQGGGNREIETFDYEQLDDSFAEYLYKKGNEIDDKLRRTSIEVGGILHEVQSELAKSGYGCFKEWLEFKGYPRSSAYEMIDVYKTSVRISDSQKK